MRYIYRAIVISVHDGDSITVDVDLGFKIWARGIKVRLFGINAPELRTEDGKAAAHYVRGLLEGNEIVLQTIKDRTGKYGRWLGIVYLNELNINKHLLEKGMAVEYH